MPEQKKIPKEPHWSEMDIRGTSGTPGERDPCENCQLVEPLDGCGFGCDVLRRLEADDHDHPTRPSPPDDRRP